MGLDKYKAAVPRQPRMMAAGVEQGQPKKICPIFQEKGECRRSSGCPKQDIKGKGVCADNSYKEIGFCNNFMACQSTHPWDEAKFGNRDEAMKRWQAESKKG